MKTILVDGIYDTRMEASDWRYSASIVGLIKYYDYWKSMGHDIDYHISDDVIEYNSEDITEERYLLFAENYYPEIMHHRIIEQILTNDELSDEQIKLVNEKLKANNIMKRIFKSLSFSNESRKKILEKINENRLTLIKDTYKNGRRLYRNFINPNSLLEKGGKICRLLNYDIDIGKKSKSISYNWDYKTYNFEDEIEFDFIPFAFSKSREAFFINNNYSISQLFHTNNSISESENPRSTLFMDFKNSSKFVDFDVEVIIKNMNSDYYESLYIRKDTIKILKQITDYKAIQIFFKVSDNYYINFEKEVTDNILNNVKLDRLIETLLKSDRNYSYNVNVLIKINTLIYGGGKMNDEMKAAYSSAKQVMKKIPENKVKSYRQKLISTIVFKDYERFCEILLQLSSYSGVVFNFAYNLFEDFEGHKNIAYTFINALNRNVNKNNIAMEEINNG